MMDASMHESTMRTIKKKLAFASYTVPARKKKSINTGGMQQVFDIVTEHV